MVHHIYIQPVGTRYAVCMDRTRLAMFPNYLAAWRFREATKAEVEVR